jgi:hypothetical protein
LLFFDALLGLWFEIQRAARSVRTSGSDQKQTNGCASLAFGLGLEV